MIPVHDLSRALDIYEGEIARAGRSEATRRKYRDVLEPFCNRYGAERALQEISTDHCRAYLDRWQNAAPATIALYVSILRGFFAFCWSEGWIESNPMDKIMRPRRKSPEELDVVSVSEDDVRKLWAAAQDWDEILCLGVLCYAGPRRTAAARLRRSDVDLARGTIRFHEKGGKVIPKRLPAELEAIIRAADEQKVWSSQHDYVIPNRWPQKRAGERSAKVIYKIVKALGERAGVNVHPHSLRAAFAVKLHDQHPGHVTGIKEALGHSRVETTFVYLRRVEKSRAMEIMRDLSWGSPVFPPNPGMPPAGFEPALQENAVPEPLRRKLEELGSRSRRARR